MFGFTAFFNENDVYINDSGHEYHSNEILTRYLIKNPTKDLAKYSKKIKDLLPHLLINKDMDYDDILYYPDNVGLMNSLCLQVLAQARKLPPYSDINVVTNPDILKDFILKKCYLLADEYDHLNEVYEDKGIELPDDEEFLGIKKKERDNDPYYDEDDEFGDHYEDYLDEDYEDLDYDPESQFSQDYYDFCRKHFYLKDFPKDDDEDEMYEFENDCDEYNKALTGFIDQFILFLDSALNSITFFDNLITKYLSDRETFMDDDAIAKLLKEALDREQTGLEKIRCNMASFEYKMINDKRGKAIFCEQIRFNDIGSFLYYDFFYGLKRRYYPAKCKNCGRYYLLTSGKYTKYCDRPLKDDPSKTCLSIGARQRYTDKCKTDPIWITYNRAYKQHYARYLKKKMTQEELLAWTNWAEGLRDRAIAGEVDFEEYRTEIRK